MLASLRRWFATSDERLNRNPDEVFRIYWTPPVPRRLLSRAGVSFDAREMDQWISTAPSKSPSWVGLQFDPRADRILDLEGDMLIPVLLSRTEIVDAVRLSADTIEVRVPVGINADQARLLALTALYDFAVASGSRTGDALASEFNTLAS